MLNEKKNQVRAKKEIQDFKDHVEEISGNKE